MRKRNVVGLGLGFALLAALPATIIAADREVYIEAPLGLPELIAPADNPMTLTKIELGKMLFFDPRLSMDGSKSCASCHNPDLGYSDATPVSVGIGHAVLGRNSPTVINSAYSNLQFWDGREPDLEGQAGGPMTDPNEMAGIPEVIVQTLNAIPEYRQMSQVAFGEYLSFKNIRYAIAAFERTILSGNSPFDKFYYGGEEDAISTAAKRGQKLFDDPEQGNCKKCHTYTTTDGYFADGEFHNVGIGYDTGADPEGRYAVTKRKEDMGAIKTPTLRDLVRTAPYFHDGRTYSLAEAVDICLNGIPNKNLSPEYSKKRKLSEQEIADIVEFLKTLTGELPIFAKPALPGL